MRRDTLENLTDADLKYVVDLRYQPPSYLAELARRQMQDLRRDLENKCLWLSDVEQVNGVEPPESLNYREQSAKSAHDAALEAIVHLGRAIDRIEFALMKEREAKGHED